ncbi:MAG: ATP-binding protein/SpoIIE family protein phosphatase [Methanoregula sp.]|nr:ATP-binding protein/SpoIIE family protein phosphatase [Methanoregula sp.]
MAINTMKCIHIGEMSGVVEARQTAMTLCEIQGFDAALSGKVAIIVTELATNLVKHAGGGDLLIRRYNEADRFGIECLALDRGPGIKDIGRCLQDGYSTGGSPGNGLGAVRRLASFFDLYSPPGKGAAFLAVIDGTSPAQESGPPHLVGPSPLGIGVVCLPAMPDEPCGDGWDIARLPGRTVILVVDGLGHGLEASEVPREAIDIFRKNPTVEPTEILKLLHASLRSTRGGAVAVTVIDERNGTVRFAGAGNISGQIISSSGTRSMVSLNGTAGVEIRKFQEFTYPWGPEAVLVLQSDGLTSHWNMEDYPGLLKKHPALIAGVLYRDHTRGRDDVTVLVVKKVGGNT